MKRLVYILLSLMLILSSCSVETSDNGDFDGFWHLEKIDTISNGGVCDLSNEKLFWGVQSRLIMLTGDSLTYVTLFNQTSDSIIVFTPFISSGMGDDTPLTDTLALRKFGIDGLEGHFYKEELKGSRMILRSSRLRLHFKKF